MLANRSVCVPFFFAMMIAGESPQWQVTQFDISSPFVLCLSVFRTQPVGELAYSRKNIGEKIVLASGLWDFTPD